MLVDIRSLPENQRLLIEVFNPDGEHTIMPIYLDPDELATGVEIGPDDQLTITPVPKSPD